MTKCLCYFHCEARIAEAISWITSLQEGVLIVNQNRDRSWLAVGLAGTEVSKQEDGRITVIVPPGGGNVELCYTQSCLFWGFLALVLGVTFLFL